MKTLIKSEGNFLTKTENEKGNFKVAYSYGSSTGNVWTDLYYEEFNSLFAAIDFHNRIIEEFNKDNEIYSWNRRLNLFIEQE